MVAAEQQNVLWVLQFQAKEVFQRFHRVIAAVHKVADEDVALVGDFPADAEELQKVVELPVDVPTDIDRGADGLNVGFLLTRATSHKSSVTLKQSWRTSRSWRIWPSLSLCNHR